MAYKYAYQGAEEVARAVAVNVPISTKTAVMMAAYLRGKSVERAKRDLEDVLTQKRALPFTRFSEGAGHKPGMGPGKYPKKTSEAFLELLNSVIANAQDKGFGSELKLVGVTAHKAATSPRYGRHRGRSNKSTHVEMIVAEDKDAKPVRKAEKPAKKAAAKKSPESEETKAPAKTAKKAAAKTAAPEPEKITKDNTPAPTATEKPQGQTSQQKAVEKREQ
jgi:large subunit ribosomal protein L22